MKTWDPLDEYEREFYDLYCAVSRSIIGSNTLARSDNKNV